MKIAAGIAFIMTLVVCLLFVVLYIVHEHDKQLDINLRECRLADGQIILNQDNEYEGCLIGP